MEDENHSFELWGKEKTYLTEQKQLHPELFEHKLVENAETLLNIGIRLPYPTLPLGYVKFHPLDFVVEEIQNDLSVSSVEYAPLNQVSDLEKKQFVHANFVKLDMSTFEAVKHLARSLKVSEDKIGIAGLKDGEALTSQRFCIGSSKLDRVLDYKDENPFIKDVTLSDKLIKKGHLWGNRFTIFLRTQTEISKELLEHKLGELSRNGFWNFYWTQRFGKRLLNHKFGLLLIQGKQERAIRTFLCDSGSYEIPFIKNLRIEANKHFENWEKMYALFQPMPYTFNYELIILKYLIEFRRDYVGALREIEELTRMWIYAYTSYLSNKILSSYAESNNEIPERLPLALSDKQEDKVLYEQLLKKDKVDQDFEKNLKRLDFIKFASRFIPTRIKPRIHSYKILPEGVAINFDLSKGSYATTFLGHIFTLEESLPVPNWVQEKIYDLKAELGIGSLKETIAKLERFMVNKKNKIVL